MDHMNNIRNIRAGIYNLPPINLRDLLQFKNNREPIDINDVEPIEDILKAIWKWKYVPWSFVS